MTLQDKADNFAKRLGSSGSVGQKGKVGDAARKVASGARKVGRVVASGARKVSRGIRKAGRAANNYMEQAGKYPRAGREIWEDLD